MSTTLRNNCGSSPASRHPQVLEKFFSLKVPVPPYRLHAANSFHSILKFPARVLKDCIRIMQLELVSAGAARNTCIGEL